MLVLVTPTILHQMKTIFDRPMIANQRKKLLRLPIRKSKGTNEITHFWLNALLTRCPFYTEKTAAIRHFQHRTNPIRIHRSPMRIVSAFLSISPASAKRLTTRYSRSYSSSLRIWSSKLKLSIISLTFFENPRK